MKIASFETPDVRISLHQDKPGVYILEYFDYLALTGGMFEFGTAEQALAEFAGQVELWNNPEASL